MSKNEYNEAMATDTQEFIKTLLGLADGFVIEEVSFTAKRRIYQLTLCEAKFQAVQNRRKNILDWNWKPIR